MNTGDNVKNFMIAADHHVQEELHPPVESDAQSELYMKLVEEEFRELRNAFFDRDIVETADACADLIWVIEGLCYSLGIPLQRVWDEVARSNMSKVSESGKIMKREDGKILKPDTYSPPDIAKVLKNVY